MPDGIGQLAALWRESRPGGGGGVNRWEWVAVGQIVVAIVIAEAICSCTRWCYRSTRPGAPAGR
jgi:hypothetical protein